MKKLHIRMLLAVACAGLAATGVFAQGTTVNSSTVNKYLISAKAGGVNYTEGPVSVVRSNGKSAMLVIGDELEIGDRVSTGDTAKAEILLNPGSYLRLGSNASFEFKTTSLDDLQLRLASGSAMFEVYAAEDFRVTVLTPNSKVVLIQSGVFRVDIAANGEAKVSVFDGKARLGDAMRQIVKKGKTGTIDGTVAKVEKFDRDAKDDLVTWSKVRAKELAKATAALKNNQNVRTSLMQSFRNGGWGIYNSFGLWVFDQRLGRWIFLPFGRDWNSPYGYSYGNCLWYYNMPPVVYYPPIHPPSSSPTTTQIVTAGDRSPIPPFIRMQETGSVGPTRSVQDWGSPSNNSSPSYSPPSSSPPSPPPAAPPADTKGNSPTKDGRD